MKLAGRDALELARDYGTPLVVYDRPLLDATFERVLAAGRRHGVRVSFAAKAFLTVPFARHLARYDIGIDVASFGELVTCERASVPPSRLTLHGAGKTDEELDAACRGRVARIVVDSVDELDRLASRSGQQAIDMLLRINTGIEAHTHEFVRTAGDHSKFGLSPLDEDRARDILRSSPALRMRGVHSHIGSQIYRSEPFAENAAALVRALRRWRSEGFESADTIIAGGGFGVAIDRDEELDVESVFKMLASSVTPFTVEVEPGRSMIARAGTTLYRVMAVKRYSQRTFVIVDGGMADNPRPALYDAHHPISLVRSSDAAPHRVTVCGRSCENDELGDAHLPSDVAAGDVLAVALTGAYTYSMASNYNRFTRPAVVAVTRDTVDVWARRETIDDVLRADE